jgi:chemotaxis protein MotB
LRTLRKERTGLDIWPGFVDALSALLLVVLFTLMVFILAQFYLSDALQNREHSLASLEETFKKLSGLLVFEKKKSAALRKNTDHLQAERGRLLTLLSKETSSKIHATSKLDAMQVQLQELNAQLQRLNQVLNASETTGKHQQIEIEGLQEKLKFALEEKVKELSAYRSEFFGKLKQTLGSREDIRIVGDRFVVQSEVLFRLGSEKLGEEGENRLTTLAVALKEISQKIPSDIPWVLRVDGHTDVLPIKLSGAKFKNNWELSIARALSVVKFLISQGISSSHLAAAGFAEFHPIDRGTSPENLARNRRIELKLDQR